MAHPRTLVLAALLAAVAFSPACQKKLETANPPQKMFTGTAAINQGKKIHLIVDVQPSWVAGRQEYLPLGFVVLNRAHEDLVITREGILLETPTGTTLPLVEYREFETEYTRQRMDMRVIEGNLLPTLNGRYPTPPFQMRPLEFFPLRQSGIIPRDFISVRDAEFATGLIYFRVPDEALLPGAGASKLLVTPRGSDTQYVVSIDVYHEKKNQ